VDVVRKRRGRGEVEEELTGMEKGFWVALPN
jgi:hypothetical protein